jgi:hypothetical protein
MEGSGRRGFLLSKGWGQAAVLVVLFGFFVLGLLAYRTYQAKPPIPARVVDPQGRVLYTGKDISVGEQVFLNNGLMEYGSVFGHGAYLGPDYTGDYLRRASNYVRESYGGRAPTAPCRKRSLTSAPTAMTAGPGCWSTPRPRRPPSAPWSRTSTEASALASRIRGRTHERGSARGADRRVAWETRGGANPALTVAHRAFPCRHAASAGQFSERFSSASASA